MYRIIVLCLLLFPFIASAQYVQVGQGTAVTAGTDASPVNVSQASQRAQFIYTNNEINQGAFAAAGVRFSSERGFLNALRIGSAPDVYPAHGTNTNAWSGAMPDNQREWIEVVIGALDTFNVINIFETFNPGAIDTVYIVNPTTSAYLPVYTATAAAAPAKARILTINFPRPNFGFNTIRIAVNSPAVLGYNEIDAVHVAKTDTSLLTELGFNIASAPGVPLPNYRVRVMHTDLDYVDAAVNSTSAQTVFSQASYSPQAGGFDTLLLSSPFQWNGFQNLLVEICYDPVTTTSNTGTVRYYPFANGYRFARGATAQCSNTPNTASNRKPQALMRFSGAQVGAGDLGVLSLSNPNILDRCRIYAQDTIEIIVQNNGQTPQGGFEVGYKLDTLAPVIETFTGTLPTGVAGIQPYRFDSLVDLSRPGLYPIKVWVSLPGDVQPLNDTLFTIIEKKDSTSFTASPDTSICAGTSVTLSAQGGIFYAWSTGDSTPFTTVTPVSDTFYTVTIDDLTCRSTDTVRVTLDGGPPKPTVSLSGPTTLCFSDSVQLTASQTQDVVWNTGDSTAALTVKTSGNYFVTAFDTGGCSQNSDTVSVDVEAAPFLQVNSSFTTLCLGDSIELEILNAATVSWSTGDVGTRIKFAPTLSQTVVATGNSPRGCAYTDSVRITVIPATQPAAPGNYLPVDSSLAIARPAMLSWSGSTAASNYDVFIWEKDSTQPAMPLIANTPNLQEAMPALLDGGKLYRWQVVAKNSCFSTAGPIQLFGLVEQPDLVVANVQAPAQLFAGQQLQVTYTITNQGGGSTRSNAWFDRVYLSFDTQLDPTDISLGRVPNARFLTAGQSYRVTQNFTLPATVFGQFRVLVVADGFGALAESDEQNNVGFDSMQQLLNISLPPQPDLAPQSVGAPTSAFGGDVITLTYEVENVGLGNAAGSRAKQYPFCSLRERFWQDAVLVSPDPTFDPDSTIQLKVIDILLRSEQASPPPDCGQKGNWERIPDFLAPDSTYTRQVRVQLPHTLFGTYYLGVLTDAGDLVQPELNQTNNLGSSAPIQITLTPPADLAVTQLSAPSTALSGTQLNLSYTVENQGANAPQENTWEDYVYLSPVDSLDSQALLLKRVRRQNGTGLGVGNRYTVNTSFVVPNGLSGAYYLYVVTDGGEDVFEFTFEQNNLRRTPTPIAISLSPSIDLVVSQITAPAAGIGREEALVTYTVTNQGQSVAPAPWYTHLFMGDDSTFDAASVNSLASYTHVTALAPGQSIVVTERVRIPNGSSGDRWWFVYTDLRNDVYEIGALDSNNVRRAPFALTQGVADLAVQTVSAPGTAQTGQTVTVSYTVDNLGNIASVDQWVDGLFLSTDNRYDPSDRLLASLSQTDSLAAGANYIQSAQVRLPVVASGNYFVVAYADFNGAEFDDTLRTNNQAAQAITLNAGPTADLVIDSVFVQNPYTAGLPTTIQYRIRNQGTAPASGFFNKLSLKTSLQTPSSPLASHGRNYTLAAGATRLDSFVFVMPVSVQGNYFLVMEADVRDEVFELSERNNQYVALISVQTPPPADLEVARVQVPQAVRLGDSIAVEFTVKNVGANVAQGLNVDAAFASADGNFDARTDPQIGARTRLLNLSPGDSVRVQLNAKFPAVREGTYRAIGQTNLRATVNETDFSNNERVSNDSTEIRIDSLPLNTIVPTALPPNGCRYYRFDAPVGLDLYATLMVTNGFSDANEMYIARERVPTPSDFDFVFSQPNAADQRILIPNSQGGRYYLMARTNKASVPAPQIDLQVQALPFGILRVVPDTVGQGIVTTPVEGAGFRDSTVFELQDQQGTVYATARMTRFVHSMRVELRWDLQQVPLGSYTLVAHNPNDSVRLLDGITVVASTGFLVGYQKVTPGAVRFGGKETFSFYFENVGNVDIPHVLGDFTVPANTLLDEVRASANVKTRTTTVPNIGLADDMIRSGNYGFVPYTVVDLKPGEHYYLSLTYSNFQGSVFPQQIRVQGMTEEEFIVYAYANLLVTRFNILNNAQSQSAAQIAVAQDSALFMDSLLNAMIAQGFFTAEELEAVDPRCPLCDSVFSASGNGFGDSTANFSPGTSPGTAAYGSITFEGGQEYLWEINKWGGTAGQDPGWDLLYTTGTLTVAATPQNPFIVRVNSLSYGNYPDYLGGWWPSQSRCWPIAIAEGGIVGFSPGAFRIDTSQFGQYNDLYGGFFYLQISGDTLQLCFQAHIPGVGEDGVPGAPGAPGECGTPGGKGGPGGPGIAPGAGGMGGPGGPGYGSTSPGCGGAGGAGGDGTQSGQMGGPGGQGGSGGQGGPGQMGGIGGNGGTGGMGGPNGDGGAGGDGGDGGDGETSGPGGFGGPGGMAGIGGSGGPSGGSGSAGAPNNPNTNPPGPPNCPVCDIQQESPDCERSGEQIICLSYFTAIGCGGAIATCAAGTAVPVLGWVACGFGLFSCANDVYDLVKGEPYVQGPPVGPPVDFTKKPKLTPTSLIPDIAKEVICNRVLVSCDPNDIKGPEGYDSLRWMAADVTWDYRIRFENDAELATTAAQRVEIRQALDPELNPLSFRVREFGFADQRFQVPGERANYATRLDLPDSLGYDVDFTAGVDIVNDELFWVFQTIDPATGLAPANALLGFLAINDSLGSGEGFVTYSIRPGAAATTGDTVTAQAEIVFDINAPIITNTWQNLIDAVAPTSAMLALPNYSGSDSIQLRWQGQDDPGGVGIESYDVFFNENGGTFQLYASQILGTDTLFEGQAGVRYGFYIEATDWVGNRESKMSEEVSTVLSAPGFFLTPVPSAQYCPGDTVAIEWRASATPSPQLSLEYSGDSLQSWNQIAGNLTTTDSMYRWILPGNLPQNVSYSLRALTPGGQAVDTSFAFRLLEAPALAAGQDSALCLGDSLRLGGSPTASGGIGPYTFTWTPAQGITQNDVPNPVAFATQDFVLQVVDQNGCSSVDTVRLRFDPQPITPTIGATDTTLISSAMQGNQWYLDGIPIPGATDPVYTPTQRGDYTVVATNGGCSSDTSAPYFFDPVGLDPLLGLDWQVYPNPAKNVINVQVTGLRQRAELRLIDPLGQVVRSEAVQLSPDWRFRLKLDGLPAGSYAIQLRTAEGFRSQTVVIQP